MTNEFLGENNKKISQLYYILRKAKEVALLTKLGNKTNFHFNKKGRLKEMYISYTDDDGNIDYTETITGDGFGEITDNAIEFIWKVENLESENKNKS